MNLLMMSSSKLKYRYPNPAILTPSSIGPSCTTTTTTTTTHNGGKNLTNPSLPCIVLGRQSAGEARNGVDCSAIRSSYDSQRSKRNGKAKESQNCSWKCPHGCPLTSPHGWLHRNSTPRSTDQHPERDRRRSFMYTLQQAPLL
jgi:hypothetical protein